MTCLTVVLHPDVERVGERARLDALAPGSMVELSRNAPLFTQPGAADGSPLEDRHLSRDPVTLALERDGSVRLTSAESGTAIIADGRPLRGTRVASPLELESGVVLELASRVVLLLHRVGAGPAQQPPALGMVGANDLMDGLRRNVLRVANLKVPVLVRGETGTGKELLARAVHDASSRANRPFVSINMAAIPPSTAASELFGHAKGAFTDAVRDHDGYFRQAHGGTLFLDEIGATPQDVQPMLLRVLDSREIQPLGSVSRRKVDVRLVAATDADLEQSISNESFRAALLHRLESYQLFVPPLRERRDDIGRLLFHFLRAELEATGELDRLVPAGAHEPTWLPSGLVAQLARLHWPGNVRQLRNVCRQLVISSRGEPTVEVDGAIARLLASAEAPATAPDDEALSSCRSRRHKLTEEELIDALRANDWQPNKAAEQLGISRSTMYAQMKRFDRIRHAKDLTRAEIEACHACCDGDLTMMARKLEVSRRALQRRLKQLGV